VRLSELAEATGTTPATLKFYLRTGLLHPGVTVNRTRAEYSEEHVARVRLVRALSEVGGLDLASVGRVLEAIDDEDADHLGLLATAQRALSTTAGTPATDHDGPGAATQPDAHRGDARTREWIASRGWLVDPADPLLDQLATAWQACVAAVVPLDDDRMDAYADAVERIARVDVDSVSPDGPRAVRDVVLGTILVDPVLVALRRLAHQHVSVQRATTPPRG